LRVFSAIYNHQRAVKRSFVLPIWAFIRCSAQACRKTAQEHRGSAKPASPRACNQPQHLVPKTSPRLYRSAIWSHQNNEYRTSRHDATVHVCCVMCTHRHRVHRDDISRARDTPLSMFFTSGDFSELSSSRQSRSRPVLACLGQAVCSAYHASLVCPLDMYCKTEIRKSTCKS